MTKSNLAKVGNEVVVMQEAETRLDLPASPGVYVLSCQGEILYVGESKNLRARWCGHSYSGFLVLPSVTLHYKECMDHKQQEKLFIRHLRPSFNGARGNYPSFKRESLKTGVSVESVMEKYQDSLPESHKAAIAALSAMRNEMRASAI